MVKKKVFQILLIFLVLMLFASSVLAATSKDTETSKDTSKESGGKACIYYFYGQGCADCAETSAFLQDLQRKNPQLKMGSYEVYYRPQNMNLAQKYFNAYQVKEESRGLPVVFTSTSYFVGKNPIINLLQEHLNELSRSDCPSLTAEKTAKIPGIVGAHLPLDVFKSLSFGIITGGALHDALRPGMIALSMLLLMVLTSLSAATQVLRRGILFLAVVFVTHFLFVVGLLLHLVISPLSVMFYRLVGWIGILFGLWITFNFFWGKRMHLLSEQSRKKVKEGVEEIISSLGVFLLALIGGVLSFANVSTTFLVLPHAFRGDEGWAALPIVLYYLLIVLFPLLLITLVLTRLLHNFEIKAEHKLIKIENWKEHYRKLIQLVVSLLVFTLGLLVLFW